MPTGNLFIPSLGLIDLFVKAHMMLTQGCQTLPKSDEANVCQAGPLKLHLFKPDLCFSVPISRVEQRCTLTGLAWDKWYQSQPEFKCHYRWVTWITYQVPGWRRCTCIGQSLVLLMWPCDLTKAVLLNCYDYDILLFFTLKPFSFMANLGTNPKLQTNKINYPFYSSNNGTGFNLQYSLTG